MSLVLNMVGGGGGGLNPSDALIHVNAPYGSTVTYATGGATVKTIDPSKAFANVDGETADYYYSIKSANFGSWTVTASLSGDTVSDTVSVSAAKQYDVELSFASPLNILVGATWANGYLNSSGNIDAQSATYKERYESEYLDAAPGKYMIGFASVTTPSNYWCAVCSYNSSKGHISRQTIGTSNPVYDPVSGLYLYTVGITLPSNTAYIRFSARTYNDAYAFFAPADNIVTPNGGEVSILLPRFVYMN